MIISIIKWYPMKITQVPDRSPNSAAVPLPIPLWRAKIPLPKDSPNFYQAFDIHILSALEAGFSEAQTSFFPCRQGAGGC
jgi:hypothetical protein